MSRLVFRYFMKLSFDAAVVRHRFSLKCTPVTDSKQKVILYDRSIYPNSFISEGTDSFGNQIVYGYEETAHKCFFFDVKGEVLCGQEGFSESGDGRFKDRPDVSLFRYPTKHTKAGPNLLSYAGKLEERYRNIHKDPGLRAMEEAVSGFAGDYYRYFLHDRDLWEEAKYSVFVMQQLHRDYAYQRGVTDIGTGAEDAFTYGRGVCQDYAHIMLAILRCRKIPCRYVTGMMEGEGESHAWVEVYTNGFWLPLDPTNDLVVTDRHIRIAHGRDYSDCLVNRGIFVGNAGQRQEITVTVEEKDRSAK